MGASGACVLSSDFRLRSPEESDRRLLPVVLERRVKSFSRKDID